MCLLNFMIIGRQLSSSPWECVAILPLYFFISIPISIVKIEILCAQVASSFSEKWPEILTRNWSSFWWLCSRLHFVLVIQFTFSKC